MTARSAAWWVGAASVVLLSPGCGAKRILVPARVDLRAHGRIALVPFTIENAKGSLHSLATQRFSEAVLASQGGRVELLEIGPVDTLMARVGEHEFGPRSARTVGYDQKVPAVFLGHLRVSDVKPSRAEAKVTVELTVRLVSTGSGGTLWRASAGTTETVGQIELSGGQPYFSAEDPNEAYGRLVGYLVNQVTRDFRPAWQKL